MTGREMIIYILTHHLEDEPIINNGELMGHITDLRLAAELEYGIATIQALIEKGIITDAHKLGDRYFIGLTKPITKRTIK